MHWQFIYLSFYTFQSAQRAKSAKNATRQVVGKRIYIQQNQVKRHQPAVNMLKIEGATCTPVNALASVPSMAPVTTGQSITQSTISQSVTASSPISTPRVSNHVNPLLGTTRLLASTRLLRGAGLQSLQVINGGGPRVSLKLCVRLQHGAECCV